MFHAIFFYFFYIFILCCGPINPSTYSPFLFAIENKKEKCKVILFSGIGFIATLQKG